MFVLVAGLVAVLGFPNGQLTLPDQLLVVILLITSIHDIVLCKCHLIVRQTEQRHSTIN